MKESYDAVYAHWLNNHEDFWAEAAEAVYWDRKCDRVLDDSRPPFYRWFPDGLQTSLHLIGIRQVGMFFCDRSRKFHSVRC